MAVKFSATLLSPFGEISQTDGLMLFRIHSTKEDEIVFKSKFNNWNKRLLFDYSLLFIELSTVISLYYWPKFQSQEQCRWCWALVTTVCRFDSRLNSLFKYKFILFYKEVHLKQNGITIKSDIKDVYKVKKI